ncbi:2-oxoglutarate dehydrogenase, E2 component, dihydrolipoamide succinyltransferase [Ruania albidiflava]|uniref:2-oxoglutarate dehydrogenase, E2 component, dihydrolipoamide succinyltransferase n=1 Tax=Ruania albidiflava TaxID=366586 RepID=UPI0023EFFF46|nr:2-oxoglutarate dehydrogenase, E2 component, dihydrolipoamide succinyltransferase [Ruania albidiflava]
MSESVKMPALGESVTEGTVTRWLKAVGEEVEVDEPLLEVSTDKVDTEVPSPVAGVVEKILVEEDETVEVGEDLVLIGSGAGGGGESPAADDAQQQESEQPAPAEPEQEQAPAAESAQEAPAQESAQEAPAQESAQEAPAGQPASGGTAPGTEVTLPALGESVTEGTVTQWLKSVGDEVAEDEPLLEVSTDKVDTEVPSPVAGTLLEIRAEEDETVEVGGVLAIIGDKSAQSAAPAAQSPAPAAQSPEPEQPKAESPEQPQQQAPKEEPKAERPAPAPAQEAAAQEPAPSPAAAKSPEAPKAASGTEAPTSYVTPLVRKLAADKGVDLSTLSGTGVGGRIRKQDVLDAAEAAAKPAPQEAPAPAPAAAKEAPVPAVSPLRGTREKMSRLRKIVAKRMVESLQVSAQLTTVLEVDVTKIARLRAKAKDDFLAREGVKLTYLPFFTMAAVEALKQYPKLNASIEDDEIVYHGSENVGIAVDTERGLIVPVIKDAGDLNLAGIARSIADLAERTRTNKATPDELTGGTFTITNTGSGGALFDTPILFQPQVGMLGVGSIVKRPVVVPGPDGGDVIAVRHMVYLAISYDHRLIDGADASRFLTAIKKRLEEGNFEGQLGL